MSTAAPARAEQPAEAGFTIIEMVIALSMLAIVLVAFSQTFIDVSSTTAGTRLNQVATTVADSVLDTARGTVPITTLATGGTAAGTAPAGVDLSQTTSPLKLAPQTTTLDGHVFTTTLFVGTCYLQASGDCTTTSTSASMERIIADVTWSQPTGCPTGVCSYVTSTLVSTGSDGLLNVNPPAAPGNPQAVAGDRSVVVSWSQPYSATAITGYQVSDSPGGTTYSEAPGTLSQTFSGLTNGTTYTFSITATSSGGTSPTTVITATPVWTVAWAGSPTVTGSGTSLTASWTAPPASSMAITGYTATATPAAGGSASSCTTTGLSCSIPGLATSSAYQVAVTAASGAATSNASTSTAAFLPAAPTLSAPASPSDGSLVATWAAAPSQVTVTGWSVSAGGQTCTPSPATATTCTLSGLPDGTPATATLTATSSGSTTSSGASAPATPTWQVSWGTFSAGTKNGTSINVSWSTPASTATITGYRVTATPTAGGSAVSVTPSATATSATITGLSSSKSYTITIAANDTGGSSNVDTYGSAVTG